jgi:hypothetical protein
MTHYVISDFQKCANRCCGENAPVLSEVNDLNWVTVRNQFLANVAFNGNRTHQDIIDVLVWFGQFNEPYE